MFAIFAVLARAKKSEIATTTVDCTDKQGWPKSHRWLRPPPYRAASDGVRPTD